MLNQICYAFSRIHNLPPMMKAALQRNTSRLSKDKGFSTKLSFRTYQHLKSAGMVA